METQLSAHPSRTAEIENELAAQPRNGATGPRPNGHGHRSEGRQVCGNNVEVIVGI